VISALLLLVRAIVMVVGMVRFLPAAVLASCLVMVTAVTPLPDDPMVHACALTYVSDLGSGFGQVQVAGLPAGGPSIDHSLWFHEPIRADEWMLLELWPLKAASARGVYSGSLRAEDGRLGVVITQEMLLREREMSPEILRRIAEYLGVTYED
jgi:acyl-CoA thioesterase II